jgi:hypothetical protein
MTKTLTRKEFQRELCNNFPGWRWTFFSCISGFGAVGKNSKGHRMEWQYSSEGWSYTREGTATVVSKGSGNSVEEALDAQSVKACSFEAKLNDPD